MFSAGSLLCTNSFHVSNHESESELSLQPLIPVHQPSQTSWGYSQTQKHRQHNINTHIHILAYTQQAHSTLSKCRAVHTCIHIQKYIVTQSLLHFQNNNNNKKIFIVHAQHARHFYKYFTQIKSFNLHSHTMKKM